MLSLVFDLLLLPVGPHEPLSPPLVLDGDSLGQWRKRRADVHKIAWVEPTSGSTQKLSTNASDLRLLNAATAPAPPKLHKVIRPSGQTILLLDSGLPSAACILADADRTRSSQNELEVVSDDLGQVRLFVDPGTTSGAPINLILNCETDEGSMSATPIELDVGDGVSLADEVLTPRGTPRPPLSGDPMSHTQQELLAAGFGLRPDPTRSPTGYSRWLQGALRPATRVNSRPVRVHHDQGTAIPFNIWSGSVTTAPNTFEAVDGVWYVPAVTGQPPTGGCPSSFPNYAWYWDGLGGYNSSDGLIQSETRQNVLSEKNSSCGTYYVWTYTADIEYWSNEGDVASWVFNVNPGDEVEGESWSAGSAGWPLTSDGAYGWYFMEDYTTGAYVDATSLQKPAGATFRAEYAEWIMEDPNSQGQRLANYGTATMWGLQAYDTTTNGFLDLNAQGSNQLEMFNIAGTKLMSASTAVDANDTIAFTFYNPGP